VLVPPVPLAAVVADGVGFVPAFGAFTAGSSCSAGSDS
jgi:hypothetical protein